MLFGVASVQLIGVLERCKEFVVFVVVGMFVLIFVWVVVIEGVFFGLVSAFGALAWAVLIFQRFSSQGIDLAQLAKSEEGIVLGGVLFEFVMYFGFGAWLVSVALVLVFVAILVALLYPVFFAIKIDPAIALCVDC